MNSNEAKPAGLGLARTALRRPPAPVTAKPVPDRKKTVVVEVKKRRVIGSDRPVESDPRLVDPESGEKIADAIDSFMTRTGVAIAQMAERLGIDKSNIYGYRRGHQVPTPATRLALEEYLGLPVGALKSSGKRRRGAAEAPPPPAMAVTKRVEGDELVITTVVRVKLSDIR